MIDLSEFPQGTRLLLRGADRWHGAIIEKPAVRMTLRIGPSRHFVALPRSVYIIAGQQLDYLSDTYWHDPHFMHRAFLAEPLPDGASLLDAKTIAVKPKTQARYDNLDCWLAPKVCLGALSEAPSSFGAYCHRVLETFNGNAFPDYTRGPFVRVLEDIARSPDFAEKAYDAIASHPTCGSWTVRELTGFEDFAGGFYPSPPYRVELS